MQYVMDYLGSVEGTKTHRLKRESDITAPYGIYRSAHPDADVFAYIDGIAEDELDIDYESSEWTEQDIVDINEYIESEGLDSEIYELCESFYKEFLNGAHIELFPRECVIAMFSMYTNSPANAWKSVQQSLADVQKSKVSLDGIELSSIDGAYGSKTKNGLVEVSSLGSVVGYYFEALMLSNMKTIYSKLAVSNPDRYLEYLNGWNNRMDELSRMA